MAKKKQNTGIGVGAKVAIMLVVFGIPILFAVSSWGLEKLYEVAPWAFAIVVILITTGYASYTSGLLYQFYNLKPPFLRFVPCVGEVTLIDLKYHLPCYILYGVAIIFLGASQLPYAIVGALGRDFATTAPLVFMAVALLALGVIQIIKGVGIVSCMKDIAGDWYKQTHVDAGAITKFSWLGYVPFVRVMALYSLNKPLSSMVTFMGTTVDSGDGDADFEEEEDDEDFAED